MDGEYFFESEEDQVTAYHEAGHAVAAIICGGRVGRVTLEPPVDDGPQRYGDTIVLWPRAPEETHHKNEILVALAGPTAEMQYLDETITTAHLATWQMDWQNAIRSAKFLVSDAQKQRALLERVQVDLHRMWNQPDHWAAVAAIADLLLAHHTICDDQVRNATEFWLGHYFR